MSSEKITEGETYTLYINGTETASLTSSETVSIYGTASGGRGMGGRDMGGGPGGGAAPADAGTAAGESGAAGIADTMLGYVKEYITPIISVLMLPPHLCS